MNKQDIAQALKEYRDQKGLSLKDLEAEMKMSYATVSNIVNFKLDDVSERMMRTVAAFLKMDDWQLMETNNFAIVHELLWEAQEYSRFFGIVAESGFGKTAALDAYKKKNPNCFYMLSDILMSGRKGFLGTIQRAMGIREGGTPAEMLEAIVVKLNSLKSPLLIIDDAGKLNDSNLRIIQLIYDRTERRCGIVMAGTPYLKEVLEKGITRNKMGFDELFRRVEFWQRLFAPTKQEMAHFCEHHGLSENKAVMNVILNTCKNFGALRAKITLANRLKDKGKLTEKSVLDNIEHKEAA